MTDPPGSPYPSAPTDPGAPDDLGHAEALELELRARLAELVTERRRAEAEAARLRQRATLPGADPAMAGTADRYAARATDLERELTDARARLRAQEGTVARLRADDNPSLPNDSIKDESSGERSGEG